MSIQRLLKIFDTRSTLLLCIICAIPLFITAYVYYWYSSPQGDEPHYLIISQTVQIYHSIDVMKDYTHGDYLAFYPKPIDAHVSPNAAGVMLPMHSIGGPLIWLLPFMLLGRLGVILFIALVTLLAVLNIYYFLLEMAIRPTYAFFVSAAFAFGSPLYIFSHLTFIEPLGMLVCIYVVRVLFQQELRQRDLIGSGIALGVMPWIHIRFALIEVVLFAFLLLRLYRENGLHNIRRYVAYLLPVVVLFLLFEGYNLIFWGTLNPAPNQANSGQVPFKYLPFLGLAGTFMDQEFGLFTNFPIFIFALPGILLTLKKKYLSLHLLMLLLFIPYLLTFTTFRLWSGGWTPPTRFLVVLVPTLAFYMAWAMQQASNRVLNVLFALCTLFAFACGVAYIGAQKLGFNSGKGTSLAMLHLQDLIHIPITDYVPSVYRPHQLHLFALWLAGMLCITAITYLLGRTRALQ